MLLIFPRAVSLVHLQFEHESHLSLTTSEASAWSVKTLTSLTGFLLDTRTVELHSGSSHGANNEIGSLWTMAFTSPKDSEKGCPQSRSFNS